jgi:hypothetical protein
MLGIPPWAQQLQGVILTLFRRMELPGVVRVSFGIENSEADVDTLVRTLQGIARRPRVGGEDPAIARDEASVSESRDVSRQIDGFATCAAQMVYGSPPRESPARSM